MLRIIAGEYRSRLLATPPAEATTRPMTDRARESIFNLLRGWWEEAAVLDLFAGVGSMGLEAVSRGAAMAVMVERDRRVADYLRRNVATLGCADRTRVVEADALGRETLLAARSAAGTPFRIVFMDPPYDMMERDAGRVRVLAQAARAAEVMERPGFLAIRSPLDPDGTPQSVEGFEGPEVRRLGPGMWLLLYAPIAGSPVTDSPVSDSRDAT